MQAGSGGVEGQLMISLAWDGDRVTGVDISSSRPLQMPRIFAGKSMDYLLGTVPLLFSLCGTAQACAAVTACERAMGQEAGDRGKAGRALLVLLETAKEHAWRINHGWAELLGEREQPEPVARLIALMSRFRATLYGELNPFLPDSAPVLERPDQLMPLLAQLEEILEESIYSGTATDWLTLDSCDQLLAWASAGESVAARFIDHLVTERLASVGSAHKRALPALDTGALDSQLAAEDAALFIARPTWEGDSCETGPFTRMLERPLMAALRREYGDGLLTRATARLLELATIPEQLRALVDRLALDGAEGVESGSQQLAPGRGIAQVEAARGRLVHRVELADGMVAGYQILAPTEWNFHPDGVLAQGLAALQAGSEEELRHQARMLINAIDPCVSFELKIN
ncbi:MAG: nickel-dependent hydrogenase large subunit [Sedimenticola sp.]